MKTSKLTKKELSEMKLGINTVGSELVAYTMSLSSSKENEVEKLMGILAKLQDNPQLFCCDTEYETIKNVAMIDGQRKLLARVLALFECAKQGDLSEVMKHLQ